MVLERVGVEDFFGVKPFFYSGSAMENGVGYSEEASPD